MSRLRLTAPCARCGIVRVVNPGGTFSLCRDCRSVMSRAEIESWVKS